MADSLNNHGKKLINLNAAHLTTTLFSNRIFGPNCGHTLPVYQNFLSGIAALSNPVEQPGKAISKLKVINDIGKSFWIFQGCIYLQK